MPLDLTRATLGPAAGASPAATMQNQPGSRPAGHEPAPTAPPAPMGTLRTLLCALQASQILEAQAAGRPVAESTMQSFVRACATSP